MMTEMMLTTTDARTIAQSLQTMNALRLKMLSVFVTPSAQTASTNLLMEKSVMTGTCSVMTDAHMAASWSQDLSALKFQGRSQYAPLPAL